MEGIPSASGMLSNILKILLTLRLQERVKSKRMTVYSWHMLSDNRNLLLLDIPQQ